MSDEIIKISSEAQLEEVVEDNSRVLLDFYADWCGPCDMMEPVIEELAAEIPTAKIDIDQHNNIASKYSVRSLPTFILIKDGDVQQTAVGVQDKAEMEDMIAT